jgi:uncharacterized protein
MKKHLSGLIAGILFGIGLMMSGMTEPSKVIGFLDIFGQWDPSLIFVMGGAVVIGLIAFSIAKRKTMTVWGDALHLPSSTKIDIPLIVGSGIFGIGWGLAGLCPGPAIVSIALGLDKIMVFVFAMILGMILFELFAKWQTK